MLRNAKASDSQSVAPVFSSNRDGQRHERMLVRDTSCQIDSLKDQKDLVNDQHHQRPTFHHECLKADDRKTKDVFLWTIFKQVGVY